ncbi:DMT family transporter [Xanthobacter tagetidis]|uniref:DMT family transporter n=1 Tax=Xanthobacter tagetidis TaxID=60216 RepID=A0A3L7AK13_9HYPH|nr:DMT family transporter [Xanthobacter tagetidis]MBB6306883.1 drug/metabolite transporter (DMT)-like permease [Xanthobacter tagetidis]RLP80050.1 DMT family transporter [Xanthobacter tagetidis]
MQRRVLIGLLLGFCGVVMFGVTLPMTRLALDDLGPWFISFGRATIGGVLAVLLVLAMGRRVPLRGRTLVDLLVATVTLVFMFPLLMAVATQTVPASHGGVVLGLLPLTTAIAAMLFAGERPSLGLIGASATGAALIGTFALRNGATEGLGYGDALLVLAVIACSCGYAVAGRLARTMTGWEVICFMLILALPVNLVGALLTFPAHVAAVAWPSWAALAYLGVISQFVGFFFWNAGLAMGGIARVGQVQLLQTFVTVGLAWPINGEVPTLETVGFAVAVVAVVAFAQRAGRKRDAT